MSNKPTATRCALKTGHEGPHMWIQTRCLALFGDCRAVASIEYVHHIDGDPTNNALDNIEIRQMKIAD